MVMKRSNPNLISGFIPDGVGPMVAGKMINMRMLMSPSPQKGYIASFAGGPLKAVANNANLDPSIVVVAIVSVRKWFR